MFTVAVHNCSVGVLPLSDTGYSRNKPSSFDRYTAACTVAKAHADAHKVMCCVHNERGKVVKSYRHVAVQRSKDKREADTVDTGHVL